MKKYSEFQVEDFLTDEFFVRWANSSDKEAEHFWNKWMENNPSKREMVMEAYYLINAIDYKDELKVSDQEHVDLFESIINHSSNSNYDNESNIRTIWNFLGLRKIAAAAMVAFCLYFGYQNIFNQPVKEESKPQIQQLVKFNPAGQKSQFKLADGTVVFLNAESELIFPEAFNDSIREVQLRGEAFFEVAENKDKPFIVNSGGVKVKVLGTSFNINQGNEVAIALVTGKVSVQDASGDKVNLAPNEMLTCKKEGKPIKSSFDPFETIGWKDKYLVFRGDDFLKVKRKLEKWYGIEIIRERPLQKDWSYTGQYYQETLERVLEGISATSEFEYKISNNQVIINPNP